MRSIIAAFVAVSLTLCEAAAQALPAIDEAGNFRQLDERPAGRSRIDSVCATHRPQGPGALRRLEEEKQVVVRADSAGTAASWYTLGCVRSLLFRINARAREGFLMPSGASWMRGAMAVLREGLNRWPDHRDMAALFAILVLEAAPVRGPQSVASRAAPEDLVPSEESLATLARMVDLGHPTPVLFRACVVAAIDRGAQATARECIARALALGSDSTWHLLRRSYLDFRAFDLASGISAFEQAVTAAHDSTSRAELGWHLYGRSPGFLDDVARMQAWQKMTRQEAAGVMSLPDSSLLPWVRGRLAVLDASNGSLGDRLARHFFAVMATGSRFNVCTLTYGGGPAGCFSLRQVDFATARIDVSATVHRLFSPATGARVIVVPLAVSGVEASPTESSNALLAELALWEAGRNRWRGGERQLHAPLGREPTLTGSVLSLPDSGGTVAWRLSVRDRLSGKTGSVLGESPDLTRGPLGLSDLVLGQASDSLRWDLDGRSLILSPSMRFVRREPLELYFQLWSDTLPREVRIALALYSAKADDTLPRLQVDFPHQITQQFAEIERELDLSRLDRGDYRLELAVRDSTGRVLATRSRTLTLE